MKLKLAIFLSGGGSNARSICRYFRGHSEIEVVLLLSNREKSGAKAISEEYGIPYRIFSRDEFYNSGSVLSELEDHNVDAVILAGFLWLIPQSLLQKYPDRILNIHPALLPKYGGKGMHGEHVHRAVHANREAESGITIHLCNEAYDDGRVLFSQTVPIDESDTPETIASKVLKLEHKHYPEVIEKYLLHK